MKVRSTSRKEAKIDESKIANEKRSFDVSDKDYEILSKLVKSASLTIGDVPSTESKTLPTSTENGVLFWGRESSLPLILEQYKRVILGMFNKISVNDIKGYNVTLYPPSIIKENTTVIKTGNDIMCRIVLVLGSPELFFVETSHGKLEATCDIFMSRNQAVLLPYGVCNTVSFCFNNNKSLISKTIKVAQISDFGENKKDIVNPKKYLSLAKEFIFNSEFW